MDWSPYLMKLYRIAMRLKSIGFIIFGLAMIYNWEIASQINEHNKQLLLGCFLIIFGTQGTGR